MGNEEDSKAYDHIGSKEKGIQDMLEEWDRVKANLSAGKYQVFIVSAVRDRGDGKTPAIENFMLVEPTPAGYSMAAGVLRMASAKLESEYVERQNELSGHKREVSIEMQMKTAERLIDLLKKLDDLKPDTKERK